MTIFLKTNLLTKFFFKVLKVTPQIFKDISLADFKLLIFKNLSKLKILSL